MRITCSALTSAGLISLIFIEQFLIKIVATIISFISTLISMFFQSFEIQKSITNHKNSATELLIIRNKLQLLLVEIKLRNKSEIEIVELYRQLVDKLADVYKTAPNTTDKAVKLAANALKVSKCIMTNRVKRYDGVITLEQRQAISKRYKRITIRLNQRDKYEFEEVGEST